MQCYTGGMIVTSAAGDTVGPEAVGSKELAGHFGRRDRKKQATRRSLRDAALKLVAERGFAHVTVEDIAEAADVATRTFFNYFPSKESAVIGADPERVEGLRTSLLARPADEAPLNALKSVLVEYAATLDEDFDDFGEGKTGWFQRFCAVRNDPELLHAYASHMATVEENLSVAMAERLGTDPRHDPYPALVTASALAAARVAAIYWGANGGHESLGVLTAVAIDALSCGLVLDKATLRSHQSSGDAPGGAASRPRKTKHLMGQTPNEPKHSRSPDTK